MRGLVCAAVAVLCGVIAGPASAQSLGELARQEEARRATGKKSVKVFTNASLAPSEIESPVPAPAPAATAAAVPAAPAACDPATSPDKCAATAEAVKSAADAKADPKPQERPAQREEDWRGKADEIKRQLEKARTEYDAVARSADDPSRSPGERASTARIASLHLKMLEGLEQRWLRLEKQAEDLKLPREWLGARPILSMRTPQ